MRTHRIAFRAMASNSEVVVAAAAAEQAQAWAQRAIAEVARIEAKYSRYRSDSIVSRINTAAGQTAVDCDDETWSLLAHADALYRSSDGLFDITSGVLRRVWNFKQPRVPAAEDLARVRQAIGWPKVERRDGTVRLPDAGMEIDFGGFGKEYAADRAGAVLEAAGVQHGYVNLAGDLRVIGPKPDGAPWQIGIRHPRKPGELLATIPVERGGLATSGDYERYFELGGKRYCHIIDPRSAMPVTHWQSVSVLAPLAVMAGNCSTICMLKQAAGLAFLQAGGVNYLAVDHTGQVHTKDSLPA